MDFPTEAIQYLNPLRSAVVAVMVLGASIAMLLLGGKRKRLLKLPGVKNLANEHPEQRQRQTVPHWLE
jgi:hypothetical protein